MRRRWSENLLFFREFRRTFHSTGALLPSGRALSRALASRVTPSDSAKHLLEVGPGTGVVTSEIIDRLGPEDQLDLVELNERFADLLRQRLESDPKWKMVARRVRVLQMPIEQLDDKQTYDVIVSGLPLNNFSCEVVQQIFKRLHQLSRPEASLSFFEYVAVRKAKSLFCRSDERQRLAGIEHILQSELGLWETDRQCVLANVPPAWVHHLQMPGEE